MSAGIRFRWLIPKGYWGRRPAVSEVPRHGGKVVPPARQIHWYDAHAKKLTEVRVEQYQSDNAGRITRTDWLNPVEFVC